MTDLDRIKKFIFAFPVPFYARGIVEKLLTHENIRKAYAEVGGEDGMRATFDALVRIGKGETQGLP